MQLDVLGPVRVCRDGREVDLGTPRQRAIVAALALSEGRVLAVDALVGRVWGDRAPATVLGTLQSYVGHLRRALEPDRAPREAATVLVTEHDGYALRIPRAGRDDARLADATGRARDLLRAVPDQLRPRATADVVPLCHEALGLLDGALESWRGTPYADLADDPGAVAERTRLGDLRTAALELSVVARLAIGRHDEVVPELEAMTRTHPLHERWWTLYAVALSRTGRQADALAALQRLRSVLDDELGVEPSLPVRELQTAILRQDASVSWSAEAEASLPTV
ncbi:BTAD domain-containing putative transcriptional regulator, partial [Nocardioides sp.]|uniref:AfsR/SARP family transcriptional regulator n=1 Tax=Nocardioides sp. TaxID=35761 RepID=UPI002722B0FF